MSEPEKPAPKPHRRPVRQRLRRGVFLLPSLFTIGNVLFGFYAIVLGLRGDFDRAVGMIVIAGILDALDGRVARRTGTESEFGKEFDSLADALTFGLTPALLTYLWGLSEIDRKGWLIPLFFILCTTIRLARFNVKTAVTDSRFFVGLPSPAGAGAIAALLFVAPSPMTWVEWVEPSLAKGLMSGALILVGALMVSTFRYPSFKQVDRQRWTYRSALFLVAVILVFAYRPLAFTLAAVGVYTLSGPAIWLWGRFRRRDEDAAEAPAPAKGEQADKAEAV